MEREYETTDDRVVELGVASEVTNGFGGSGADNPDQQPNPGILEG
ncbi:benenodin family lasso peptide [Sphingobium scionense]|uniref:Benenodin family lasso peptide n=2 Tax=Sphingobium TaxID=165695 RepID=A0A6M4G7E0_SPHYA|nr:MULTISPECIES: benenodin family lasso peptide [Sphingomonadaceae]MBB4150863.1 hypothetical protein [Sphingobium scionense]PZU06957.1 MAG: hypothetical protein DI606_17330 [Sphingobium sp.]QHD66485.1 benenodin family lasso peptide [Sphingobium yanoikuyae]QJR02173.1 benenodin family lasso peptide [Sphingobium yanoikuyae]